MGLFLGQINSDFELNLPFQPWPYSSLHAFDWCCPNGSRSDDTKSHRSFPQDIRQAAVSAWLVPNFYGFEIGKMILFSFLIGTVVADIAKSRSEIESSRLLVLSAALQVRDLGRLLDSNN